MRSSTPKLILVGLIAGLLLAIAWSMHLNRDSASETLALQTLTHLDTPRPVADFALLDHHSKPVGVEAWRGRWRILFFGFTHCPAVCPNTLSLLDAVVSHPDLAAQPPAVTLVSVDPERDDPARLHSYLRNFNPDFAGITGDADSLANMRKALYVPLQRIETEQGYTLDHGSALILLNPDAEVVGFMTPPHRIDEIAADLKQLLYRD